MPWALTWAVEAISLGPLYHDSRENPMGRVAETIRAKLTAGLHPTRLDIIDESHRHAGHAGARAEGESHFQVAIVSPAFAGQSRVARQRLVYGILAEELRSDIHALSLTTLTPDEDNG
jgi:BolA protein